MKQQLIILMLALMLILGGCQKGDDSSDPAEAVPGNSHETNIDIQTNYAFAVRPIEGGTTEVLAFNEKAPAKPGYQIDLLPGAALTPLGGDDWSESYYITEPGGGGGLAITLLSCPADPIAYFQLNDQAELDEKLIAYIFTTDARHDGQLKAVADFEYTLAMDYYGTREGQKAFQVEFLVPEKKVHSIRFLSANDDISENYTGISVNIELSMNDSAAYAACMQMLDSLRRVEA